jgi:hypothetical protein
VADEVEHLLLLQCQRFARDRVDVVLSVTERECLALIEAACRRLRVKREALRPRDREALERLVLSLGARGRA